MAGPIHQTKLFRQAERATLLFAVVIIAFYFLWTRADRPSGTAHVSIGGEEVMTVDLATAPDRIISLREEWNIPAELEIKDGKIRFINVTCPDHTCEKTGFISSDGQAAVCMPNRAVVTVVGG